MEEEHLQPSEMTSVENFDCVITHCNDVEDALSSLVTAVAEKVNSISFFELFNLQ